MATKPAATTEQGDFKTFFFPKLQNPPKWQNQDKGWSGDGEVTRGHTLPSGLRDPRVCKCSPRSKRTSQSLRWPSLWNLETESACPVTPEALPEMRPECSPQPPRGVSLRVAHSRAGAPGQGVRPCLAGCGLSPISYPEMLTSASLCGTLLCLWPLITLTLGTVAAMGSLWVHTMPVLSARDHTLAMIPSTPKSPVICKPSFEFSTHTPKHTVPQLWHHIPALLMEPSSHTRAVALPECCPSTRRDLLGEGCWLRQWSSPPG